MSSSEANSAKELQPTKRLFQKTKQCEPEKDPARLRVTLNSL